LIVWKKRKCYIYTRVSTAMQVDGYSLEAQKEKLKKYAAYVEVLESIIDTIEDPDYIICDEKHLQSYLRNKTVLYMKCSY